MSTATIEREQTVTETSAEEFFNVMAEANTLPTYQTVDTKLPEDQRRDSIPELIDASQVAEFLGIKTAVTVLSKHDKGVLPIADVRRGGQVFWTSWNALAAYKSANEAKLAAIAAEEHAKAVAEKAKQYKALLADLPDNVREITLAALDAEIVEAIANL